MSDTKFVNAMKPSRASTSPDWAITKLKVYRSEMLELLQQETDEVLYWEVLRSQKGKLYIKYDEDTKAYAEKIAKDGIEEAKRAAASSAQPAGNRPQTVTFPEDDIPF
jgi:hypothetical protein